MFYTSNVNNTALYLMYRTNGGLINMNIAWKEIKISKSRFIILVSIVFLVSLLTLIISFIANCLSIDNSTLIKDMPERTFYMESDADETYNLTKIDTSVADKVTAENKDASGLSIQM